MLLIFRNTVIHIRLSIYQLSVAETREWASNKRKRAAKPSMYNGDTLVPSDSEIIQASFAPKSAVTPVPSLM